jgi:hypothetical protein
MNVRQMSSLKHWHVAHRDSAPIEYHAWDAVLILWMLGWVGVPPALLLHWDWAVLLCVPMFFAPPLYVRLRKRLHRRGALRCDWLPVLSRPTR